MNNVARKYRKVTLAALAAIAGVGFILPSLADGVQLKGKVCPSDSMIPDSFVVYQLNGTRTREFTGRKGSQCLDDNGFYRTPNMSLSDTAEIVFLKDNTQRARVFSTELTKSLSVNSSCIENGTC